MNTAFWPAEKAQMQGRIADLRGLNVAGKAVPLENWNPIKGSTDCLGGGGAFASLQGFLGLVSVVMVGGSTILNEKSYV